MNTRTGEQRAAEAARGIFRDEHGRIMRSEEWNAERRELLLKKREDMARRIKNIDAELRRRFPTWWDSMKAKLGV